MSAQSVISPNPILSNYAQGIQNSSFIATKIFPVVGVSEAESSGKIPRISKDHFVLSDAKRAPRSATPEVNVNPIDGYIQYNCVHNALGVPVDFTEKKGKVIDLMLHNTMVVQQKIELAREKAVADILRTSGNYTLSNTHSPANKWSNTSTSDPLADIALAKAGISTNIGREDGIKVMMGVAGWNTFKVHPKVLELIKYSQAGVVTLQLAAALLEVDEVYVGRAVSAATPTSAMTSIWGDDVIVYSSQPAAGQQSLYSASFGIILAVKPFDRPVVDTFTKEDGLVEVVRSHTWEDILFHGQAMGYLVRDVNA